MYGKSNNWGFFELEPIKGTTVSSIIEILNNQLVNTLTLYETNKSSMAVKVFNVITDLQFKSMSCSSDIYGETDDL